MICELIKWGVLRPSVLDNLAGTGGGELPCHKDNRAVDRELAGNCLPSFVDQIFWGV